MEIGSKLKNARNSKGFTQEQAAEALSVSRQTISSWENNRTYPDIISVIKMSDLYSVSLDHLLKEEKSMNQTYHEFLEESTNTVKATQRLEKIILLSTCFLVWVIAMAIFWLVKGPATFACNAVLRWIMLPLILFITTVWIAKNNYWGKGNWLSVPAAALAFLTVPYTSYMEASGTATDTFRFPNPGYMLVGIAVAACGIAAGSLWNKKRSR